MQIQYIRRSAKNHKGNPIKVLAGVMVSTVNDGKLKFGFSLLNPIDAKAVEEQNVSIRKEIAAKKKAARSGKGAVEGLPQLLPVFDKKEAVRLALEKAADQVTLDKVSKRIRREFYVFCRKAIAQHHAKDYLV